jgi:xylulose-5-phosphate/fructose-6-phosphate phosphoketolase
MLLRGYGYEPIFVSGDEPEAMHRLMAEALDVAITSIRRIQATPASAASRSARPGR